MSVHRYTSSSVNLPNLIEVLPPSAGPSIVAAGPPIVVDIDLVDDLAKPDLDAAMDELGWAFVATNPASPADYLSINQVGYANLLVDASTVSTVFSTLLSVVVTTDADTLDIMVTASVETLVFGARFRVLLDGAVLVGGGGGLSLLGTQTICIGPRQAVAAGPHTVEFQWRTTAVGGTVRCRPVTAPEAEHATMRVTVMSS